MKDLRLNPKKWRRDWQKIERAWLPPNIIVRNGPHVRHGDEGETFIRRLDKINAGIKHGA